MRQVIYLLIVIFFSSCSQKEKDRSKEVVDKAIGTKHFSIPDSVFLKSNKEAFTASDANFILNNNRDALNSVNKELLVQLQKCMESDILEAFFYSKIKSAEEYSSMVLLTSDLESSYFMTITLDKEGDIISCLRLTNDSCDLVEQNDEMEEIWCNYRESSLLTSNEFRLIELHKEEISYDEYSLIVVDSLTKKYEFNSKGNLSLINKDSVRMTDSIPN